MSKPRAWSPLLLVVSLLAFAACAPVNSSRSGFSIRAVSSALGIEFSNVRFGAFDDISFAYTSETILGSVSGDDQEFVVTLSFANTSNIRADNYELELVAFDAAGNFVNINRFVADEELLANAKTEKTLVGNVPIKANAKTFFAFVRSVTLTNQAKRGADLVKVAANLSELVGKTVDPNKL
jgi:hypothetical protein